MSRDSSSLDTSPKEEAALKRVWDGLSTSFLRGYQDAYKGLSSPRSTESEYMRGWKDFKKRS